MADATCTVKVVVNCRPLLGFEKERGAEDVLTTDGNEITIKGKTFAFDNTLPQGSTQEDVFKATASPLLDSVFNGFNATVMAYGQTGSGKTYTMGSAFDASSCEESQKGIIRRVMDKMFGMIGEREAATTFTVKLSFLEIYHEDICDLLTGESAGHPQPGGLRMVGGAKPGDSIEVMGLTEHVVNSPEEMENLLAQGSGKRHTSSTKMNEVSSRSHAICTITLLQRPKVGVNGITADEAELQQMSAKFHLVDLAGSERAKSTGAEGDRLKEGISINLSLSVLGNVISALGDEDKQGSHVPYRESTLTRMLQDSLGGNSQTVLVGCVSPADYNLEESRMCLQYVHRARNIKNRPVENRDPAAAKLLAMRVHIKQLTSQVRSLGGDPQESSEFGPVDSTPCAGAAAYTFDTTRHDEEEIRGLNRKLAAAQRQNIELLRATEAAEKTCTVNAARAQKAEARSDRWQAAAEQLKRGEDVALDSVEAGGDNDSVVEKQLARIGDLEKLLDEASSQGFSCGSTSGTDAMEQDSSFSSADGSDAEAEEDDEEAEQAKEEAEQLAKDFEHKQNGMQGQLEDLEQELKDREKMMQNLASDAASKEQAQKFDIMRADHAKKEQKLMNELRKVQSDLEKLRKNSNKSTSALAQQSELRARELRLKQDQKKVEAEKRRLVAMERQQARKDAEMARQQNTIEELKRQKVEVRRRMEQDALAHSKRQKGLKGQMLRLQREKERKHAELVKKERAHALKVNAMQQKMDHNSKVMEHARSKEAARRVQRNARQTRGKGLRKCQLRQIETEIEHEVTQLAKAERLEALNADKSDLCEAIAKAKANSRTEQAAALTEKLSMLEATINTEQMALKETDGVTSGFSIPDKPGDAKCVAESLCEQVVKDKLQMAKLKREVSETQKEAQTVRRQMRLVKRQQMEAEQRYQEAMLEPASVVQQPVDPSPRSVPDAPQEARAQVLAPVAPAPVKPARMSFAPPPPPPRPPTPVDAEDGFGAVGAHSFSDGEEDDDADMEASDDAPMASRRHSCYNAPTVSSKIKARAPTGIKPPSTAVVRGTKRKDPLERITEENINCQPAALTPNKERVRDERGRIALKRMRKEKEKQKKALQAAMENPEGAKARTRS